MNEQSIYRDIAARTGGDIYVGVVGPVRSGKSTFIKKFMEELVLPNIAQGYSRERAVDELPQSAAGKTVMTTEPKFVPEEGIRINIDDGNTFMNVRLVDCVGYMHDGALGGSENGSPRMVKTPWSDEEMEFTAAAEFGTRKVIREHSTIGIVVTTDGSIGDIPRSSYEVAEKRVLEEMKLSGKPFAIILNSADPMSGSAEKLANKLEEKYGAPVALVNILRINSEDIKHILGLILDSFPVSEVRIKLPEWLSILDETHPVKMSVMTSIGEAAAKAESIGNVAKAFEGLCENEYIKDIFAENINMADGSADFTVTLAEGLYYNIIKELTGFEINDEKEMLALLSELSSVKREYDKVKEALDMANDVGYGIVMPGIDELKLEEPQVSKDAGGNCGIKLKASAQSIHMIRANIETEINPIVGTEERSKELIENIMHEFEEDPKKIWDSNMFGKSLYELVNDGLHSKLEHMPDESRQKLSETLERVINEGSGGLICIIL